MPKGVHLPRVTLNCARCGRAFSRIASDHDRVYCTNECRLIARRPRVEQRACAFCGAMTLTNRHHPDKRYCSTSCARRHWNQLRRERILAPGQYRDRKQAKGALLARYGCCQACGWAAVAAVLELHHLDRNRRRNVDTNLRLLCPNCHAIEHYQAGDGQFAANIGLMRA